MADGKGEWARARLDRYLELRATKGFAVGDTIALDGVRGPDPRDPALTYELRVEAIRSGQVILSGVAHESGEYVWVSIHEDDHRVPVMKVLVVGDDAVVLAPVRRLLWERAPRPPF